MQAVYEESFRSMDQLAQLLIAGVWHDSDSSHDELWCDVLQKLVGVGTSPLQQWNAALEMARRFPAFIALAVMGIAAILRGRDSLLIRLATDVEGRNKYDGNTREPAAQALHYLRLANEDWIKQLPRWGDTRWSYPASHLFLTDLRGYFTDLIPTDEDFEVAYRSFEYRLGLIQERIPGKRAISGEYVGDWMWEGDAPRMELALRRDLEKGRATVWRTFFGGADELGEALLAQRETLKRYADRW